MNRTTMTIQRNNLRPVVVIHIAQYGANREPEAFLEEALGLCKAADLEPIASEILPIRDIHPGTYIKKGNVDRLKILLESHDHPLIYINTQLSPVQHRNLEKIWQCKVIDRTSLIIEIFGMRANTSEGKLQVYLASLQYQRSRLVRSWTHLERQRGGAGFMGGPGESQLELDKRMLDDRIIKIKKELKSVVRTRSLHRAGRSHMPTIALVGYTNSGKSTLFNRLTRDNVLAKDLLFATLDPTIRKIRLPNEKNALLSDTVGFISDLPTSLVIAFKATLEEVCQADIIIHVHDISHPDAKAQEQDVLTVLEELGIKDIPIIDVYNKLDLLNDEQKEFFNNVSERPPHPLLISALKGVGLDELLNRAQTILIHNKFYWNS
jgi:GTP-binding protein HflX